jgi:hypothetical protein
MIFYSIKISADKHPGFRGKGYEGLLAKPAG